jgi:RNA polymerase sigma factor (sigma-70 family)
MAGVQAKKLVDHDLDVRVEELSDEDLLERFLEGEGSESQDAFRTLVGRHGPMVLGVCRHVLHNETDAEDAFQATFLALARKGASIRNRRFLSNWLHEVAHRIACKARVKKVRPAQVERKAMAMLPRTIENDDPQETAIWNELRPILHEEVNWLPVKFGILVILSYMEGKTNEEVAELLQCPVGTVKGRLSHARELLRRRLMRRGMVLSAAFLLTALSRGVVFAEALPAGLADRTVHLAGTLGRRSGPVIPKSSSARYSAGTSATTSVVSPANLYRQLRGFGNIRYPVLFAILFLSMAVGIGLTLRNGGNSSPVQGAFSAFTAWRASGFSCH